MIPVIKSIALDPTQFGVAKTVWLNYFDNPVETTMGDVAIETGFSRAMVRHATQTLVQADLLRAHPTRAGLFEHDYYDDPTTAFEEAFHMKNDETPTSAIGNRTEAQGTNCRCGCGEPTIGKKAEYRPGHDARHAGVIGRALAETQDSKARANLLNRLPSEALKAKAQAAFERALAKADRKKAGLGTGRLNKAVKSAKGKGIKGTVKVGRWEYPAEQHGAGDGKMVRNSKRDGSGEWVPVTDKEALSFTKSA